MLSRVLLLSLSLAATGCSVHGASNMSGGSYLKLSVKSATFEADRLVINYEIANEGKRPIFIIDVAAENALRQTNEHLFVEYDSAIQLLRVSSYIAELPRDRLVYAPMSHPITKIAGRDVRKIVLSLPLRERPPYPEQVGAVIDKRNVRQVELRLGAIPCESLPSHKRSDSTSDYVTATVRVRCNGEEDAITAFQFLLEDRRDVQ